MISDRLHFRFFHQQEVRESLPALEKAVMNGEKTVSAAVDELFSN